MTGSLSSRRLPARVLRHRVVRRLEAVLFQALLLLALPWGIGPALAAEAQLAIKGYDPVSYFTEGKPTPGKPELEYEWDEQRYRFANAANMASFKKNPGHYMPRFGNICAGSLAYGLAWDANPELWTIHEGRLYLLGSPDSHDAFLKDPKLMISAAQRNDARLRMGQPLVAEVALPAKFAADAPNIIKQCRQTRAPGCWPEPRLAEIEYILSIQPKSKLPKQEAAQP